MPDGQAVTPMTTRPTPAQSRAAELMPASINPAARTVQLVWSTGAEVARVDWMTGRRYIERLSMKPAHVRMARLESGAPLLTDHRLYESEAVVGVVTRAWLEAGQGMAEVRFIENDAAADAVWNKVSQGALRHVSVTYMTYKVEVDERAQVETRTAIDWEPLEISFVPVPADAGASVRSADPARTADCEFVRAEPTEEPTSTPQEFRTMPETETAPSSAPAAPVPAPQPTIDADAIRRAAVTAERTRAADIRARARSIGLPETVAEDLIVRGVEGPAVAEALVDAMASRGGQAHSPAITATDRPSGDDPAVKREAIETCIAARASRNLAKPVQHTDHSRQYEGLSVLQMLASYARDVGHRVNASLPPAALYHELMQMRVLSTSDFPLLLANAGNKIMVMNYMLANVTYRSIFARKTFRDFKAHSFLRSGDFPQLLVKGETAEFQLGAMSEARNPITLATYGRIIALSRQTLVNDDMGAFADMPAKAGRRVADFENSTAWAVMLQNGGAGPTIFEKNLPTGRPLFHTADHGNLASGGTVIDVGNVGIGRAAMMKQASLDGLKLNIAPRYLVVGPDRFTQAQQFTNQVIQPATDAATNPFKGQLEAIGDANLAGNAWHLFADPGDVETLVYGYLEGAEGPQLVVREGFSSDGVDMRLHLDFAVGAVDYRGAYRNPGA